MYVCAYIYHKHTVLSPFIDLSMVSQNDMHILTCFFMIYVVINYENFTT